MEEKIEEFIRIYQEPPNRGEIKDADIRVCNHNKRCGDRVEIFIKLDKEGKIKEAKFIGRGCILSQVGASLILKEAIGKRIEEIKEWDEKKVLEVLGLKELSPARMKCASLGLRVLKKGLEGQ